MVRVDRRRPFVPKPRRGRNNTRQSLAGGAKSQEPEPNIIGPSPFITTSGSATTVANTENVRGRREAQRHVGA